MRCEVGRDGDEDGREKSGEDTMERTRGGGGGGEEEEEEGLLTGGLALSLSSSSSSSPSPYIGGLGSFCDYALARAS